MQLIRKRVNARAALVGNPSDGYNGRTISVIVRNFQAEVVLYEWEDLELVLSEEDRNRFESIHDLARDVKLHGYYGGIRLVKGTIKKFAEYCYAQKIQLHDRNFSVRYSSNIPRQVGLAGSTAIVVATLRCLMEFYNVQIPLEIQPSLALAVETQELGIAAGLQDRVIEVYEGVVYMDFSRESMQRKHGYDFGIYERLDPKLLPPLYLAYKAEVSEPTEIFHNDIRARYLRGETKVVEAMQTCAALAARARVALAERNYTLLAELMNTNFDTRRSIYQLSREHVEMIDVARAAGASANFAGSGGAIIGTYADEQTFERVSAALSKIGCMVIKPAIS